MSERDRRLIDGAGLTVSRLAELIDRSRQAVTRGVEGDDDYFTPGELAKIAERSKEKMPDKSEKIHEVVANTLRELADQIGQSATSATDLVAAVAKARRLWLALPDYSTSYGEQTEAYQRLFTAINKRQPGTAGDPGLQVIVWSSNSRSQISLQFYESWYERRKLAIITSEMVEALNVPMIIVDPDIQGGQGCFTLAASGFAPLAPATARSRVREFAGQLTTRMRERSIPYDSALDLEPDSLELSEFEHF